MLKLPAINKAVVFNSASNVGRSLVNPLFIAALSYLLIRSGGAGELQNINKINALVNLLLTFSGWGLKDYLVKESAGPAAEFNANWNRAFYSKFILLPLLLIVALCCFKTGYLAFISLLLVLRTFNALYEPVIILRKKNLVFFLFDGFSALLLLLLIFFGVLHFYTLFFYLLTAVELLKVLLNGLLFKLPAGGAIKFKELVLFLKDTRFYFFLVLVSFFQGRADLYLLGFFFEPEKFNEYQLLSSLISLAQIVIASFVISYSKLFYRDIGSSSHSFRRLVLGTGALVAVGSAISIYVIFIFLYRFEFSALKGFFTALNIAAFSFTLYEMYYYTRQKWLNKTLLFLLLSGLANAALSVLLIPVLGISGALAGNTFAMLLLGGLMWLRRVRLSRKQQFE